MVSTSFFVPDDIWISIFEHLSCPADLAIIVRTCRRFRSLASKPLLRELRWAQSEPTERNLDAWAREEVHGGCEGLVMLPRKVTIGLQFDFWTRNHWPVLTNEMHLHDRIHLQLQSFTMLHELVFIETTISPYTYTVLASIPTLRSLSILECTFISLPTSFSQHRENSVSSQFHSAISAFDFTSLPLTSLHLHDVSSPSDPGPGGFAGFLPGGMGAIPPTPMHLITAAHLRSLSITWTSHRAMVYSQRNWPLSCIEHLEVIMRLVTRDLVDSLLGFVERCHPAVRIALSIECRNFSSDQQNVSFAIPLRGVWKYRGPLAFAATFGHRVHVALPTPVPTLAPPPTSVPFPIQVPISVPVPVALPVKAERALTHLAMNEPLQLTDLLRGLEKLPSSIQTLELQMPHWDIELLFAVRELFPEIKRLVVRYGRGVLPADLFVTLGSEILFGLSHIHTFKLLKDKSCYMKRPNSQGQSPVPPASQWGAGAAAGLPPPQTPATPAHHHHHHHHHPHPMQQIQPNQHLHPQHHQNFSIFMPSSSSPSTATALETQEDASDAEEFSSHLSGDNEKGARRPASGSALLGGLAEEDLKDYLVGWNRYCRHLRYIQIDQGSRQGRGRGASWERRWEGGSWIKVEAVHA